MLYGAGRQGHMLANVGQYSSTMVLHMGMVYGGYNGLVA